MKLLEPLMRSKVESRYTLNDYASWLIESFNFNGHQYPVGLQTTQAGQLAEPIGTNFVGHVQGGLKANGVVAAARAGAGAGVFAGPVQVPAVPGRPARRTVRHRSARCRSRSRGRGRRPATCLARMVLDIDMAGNSYWAIDGTELVRMRPDWVDIILASRQTQFGKVGYRRVGYAYYEDGQRQGRPSATFLPDEVAHWAPMPDPEAEFRGMSWMTPVVREIQGDAGYTRHKLKFLENAATPNLAVTLAPDVSPEAFDTFVEKMDAAHKGDANAYKTLYLGGGADVTVVGADMKQLDFKLVQGAGETRIAAAAGVGAVMAQFSEGLAGQFVECGELCGRPAAVRGRHRPPPVARRLRFSLKPLIDVPGGSELWYDDRDIPFLQEDARDAADIFAAKANAVRVLTDGGYDPETVVLATDAFDIKLLEHSGKLSVQLQTPGENSEEPAADRGRGRRCRHRLRTSRAQSRSASS